MTNAKLTSFLSFVLPLQLFDASGRFAGTIRPSTSGVIGGVSDGTRRGVARTGAPPKGVSYIIPVRIVLYCIAILDVLRGWCDVKLRVAQSLAHIRPTLLLQQLLPLLQFYL
jgi:hypothetical protein